MLGIVFYLARFVLAAEISILVSIHIQRPRISQFNNMVSVTFGSTLCKIILT